MRRRRCVRFGFAACSTWVGVSCTSEGSKTLLRVHWHAVHAPPSGPNASAHPPCQPGIVVCHCWASSTPSVAHMAVVWFLASHAHASPDPAATSGCVQAADTMQWAEVVRVRSGSPHNVAGRGRMHSNAGQRQGMCGCWLRQPNAAVQAGKVFCAGTTSAAASGCASVRPQHSRHGATGSSGGNDNGPRSAFCTTTAAATCILS